MKSVLSLIFTLAILVSLTAPAQAQDGSVEKTIGAQIAAFQADDFAQAFSYASPSIRNIFRTADNFGRMVVQGYPMVWRPASIEYLDQGMRDGATFQKVLITDQKGGVHVLEYRMLKTEGGWKINGVQLLDSSAVAV